MVIGGGVSGIQASLDLADQGHLVYLVEREPSIGGKMAQLDKTFPTLDCSICILAPKMVEVSRHPNINLLAYSEVKEVSPIDGGNGFKARILKKSRYVDSDLCTGCRLCSEKCPQNVPNEFNEGLNSRKAIYIPFPQAVPAIATIDSDYCLHFTKGICGVCEKICPAGAIDFEQEPRELELEVKAIVVATGFNLLDPKILPQYNYGRFPDVLTSLQFERIMCASGPMSGELLKPSDGEKPEKVVFIQCVGSRNRNVKPYCSQICCMYATKQAITAKEHDPEIDVTILYNDLKAFGKNHEELIQRAENTYGVRYVKGLPGEVLKDVETGSLLVRYTDLLTGEVTTAETDIVVLCPAVTPAAGAEILAGVLGIKSDEYGFYESANSTDSVDSGIEGIYLCGMCEEPKDISSSVTQASAAAAKAALRTDLVKAPEVEVEIAEREISAEPRIGVFICDCGINISSTVDVPQVVKYASELPNVIISQETQFACSKDIQLAIQDSIEENDLNRIVVASCTPRTHEPLFRETCNQAGLNPYLFEMVNIREHDSWVHQDYPKEATDKAKDLVRMAVAKATLLNPLTRVESTVEPSVLVLGGGLSGLAAAKTIADKGFHAYIVERTDSLGGRLLEGHSIPFEYLDGRKIVGPLIDEVLENSNITCLLQSELKEVDGSIGDFKVTLLQDGEERTLEVGAIIIATGAEELRERGLFGYEDSPDVLLLTDLDRLFREGQLEDGETTLFILCAGSREAEGRSYCSRVCCGESIDLAARIRERYPNSQAYILYRDIRLPFGGEEPYRLARERGVIFIRYDSDNPPEVEIEEDGELQVSVFDVIAKLRLQIDVDRVVLATPVVPRSENRDLASMLKVPVNQYGFFMEAHPKLRPVEFENSGIYLCGPAHSPQWITESYSQALAAASKALIPLMQGRVLSEATIAEVDPDECIGCANCVAACPYNAITIQSLVAQVDKPLCRGCGICAVECPAGAITLHHFTDDQLSAMIQAAMEEPISLDEPRILSFFCNWCAYAGADMAGVSRFNYPPNVRIIRVMCSGRVEPKHILQAFLLGVDAVLIGGCHPGDCHYISGNLKAEERVEEVKRWLKETGVGDERLRIGWFSAGEGKQLAEELTEFTEQIRKIGPNPLRKNIKEKD